MPSSLSLSASLSLCLSLSRSLALSRSIALSLSLFLGLRCLRAAPGRSAANSSERRVQQTDRKSQLPSKAPTSSLPLSLYHAPLSVTQTPTAAQTARRRRRRRRRPFSVGLSGA